MDGVYGKKALYNMVKTLVLTRFASKDKRTFKKTKKIRTVNQLFFSNLITV